MIDSAVFAVQVVFLVLGCLFFAVGTLGLFRFSDTLTRIHALTKVDNLGLGFIVLALSSWYDDCSCHGKPPGPYR